MGWLETREVHLIAVSEDMKPQKTMKYDLLFQFGISFVGLLSCSLIFFYLSPQVFLGILVLTHWHSDSVFRVKSQMVFWLSERETEGEGKREIIKYIFSLKAASLKQSSKTCLGVPTWSLTMAAALGHTACIHNNTLMLHLKHILGGSDDSKFPPLHVMEGRNCTWAMGFFLRLRLETWLGMGVLSPLHLSKFNSASL